MKITILSKNFGSQTINTDSFDTYKASTSSTIFKIVEHIWDEWFTHNTQPGAPMGRDIRGMYYGEGDQPAIYSKKGAIRQGIENILEYLSESDKQAVVINTRDIIKMDVESAFI